MVPDLGTFREKLLARRTELERETDLAAASRAPVELDQTSVGRLSRVDALQAQAMAMAQQRRRQSELSAIDAALRRIDGGVFGYCLKCGDEIPKARLENMPTVTLCIDCARQT